MNRYNYYRECLVEAMSDAGISASEQQIDMVARVVEGAAEMASEACGDFNIPHPSVAAGRDASARHARELAEKDREIAILTRAIGDRLGVRRDDHQFITVDDGRIGVHHGRFRPI